MIELNGIKKTYRQGKVELKILRDISLQIKKGEFVAIMGPSGSGKTTLMNLIGCLDKPDSGLYLLGGIEVNRLSDNELTKIRNEKIGFIFQNYNLLARTSAERNVELPMIYGNILIRKKRCREALSIVGLQERIHHKPNELSGGQQQRVAIARALINNPSIILADEPTGNLDSHSGKEIMRILQDLNKKGVTIVIVTHDSNVAHYARRIIHVTDGKILTDRINNSYLEKAEPMTDLASQIDQKGDLIKSFLESSLKKGGKFGFLKMTENLRMGVFCLLTNKVRTLLTVLGLVIGVASVIAMISIGHGAFFQSMKIISTVGRNSVFVYLAPDSKKRFSMNDVKTIMERCDSVYSLAPASTSNSMISYRGEHLQKVWLNGTVPEWIYIRNRRVVRGEMFSEEDIWQANKVAVIGSDVVEKLFKDRGPVGEYIAIDGKARVKVIGILDKAPSFTGVLNFNKVAILPFTTLNKRIIGSKDFNELHIMAVSPEKVNEAVKEITSVLNERFTPLAEEKPSFEVMPIEAYVEMTKKSTITFTYLLGIIAAISLVVGGIGIMNIMLVSVTERIREIGIRKAMGAQKRDILGQFTLETLIICMLGGSIGIIAGIVTAIFINKLTKWVTLITFDSILLAFISSCIVCLLAGIYPAIKASQLNPIEALRYE